MWLDPREAGSGSKYPIRHATLQPPLQFLCFDIIFLFCLQVLGVFLAIKAVLELSDIDKRHNLEKGNYLNAALLSC